MCIVHELLRLWSAVENEHSSGGLYADALVYDVLHTAGTAGDVRGLLKIEDRFVGLRQGRWLEPACGSGRYLRAGERLGQGISGFDADAAMIAFVRTRQSSADVRVALMESFVIDRWRGRFSLAFNLINTIRHLESDAAMLAHLGEVAESLKPDGVYVVGLSLAHYGHEGPSEDVWKGGRGSLRVTQIVQFEPGTAADRTEQVYSHLMIERGGVVEHRDSLYALRTYNLLEWQSLVGRSAMELVGCVDEQGRDMDVVDGCYRLFVLRKR